MNDKKSAEAIAITNAETAILNIIEALERELGRRVDYEISATRRAT